MVYSLSVLHVPITVQCTGQPGQVGPKNKWVGQGRGRWLSMKRLLEFDRPLVCRRTFKKFGHPTVDLKGSFLRISAPLRT